MHYCNITQYPRQTRTVPINLLENQVLLFKITPKIHVYTYSLHDEALYRGEKSPSGINKLQFARREMYEKDFPRSAEH